MSEPAHVGTPVNASFPAFCPRCGAPLQGDVETRSLFAAAGPTIGAAAALDVDCAQCSRTSVIVLRYAAADGDVMKLQAGYCAGARHGYGGGA